MLRRRRESTDALAGVSLSGVLGRTERASSAGQQVKAPDPAVVRAAAAPAEPLQWGRVNLSPRGFAFVTTVQGKAYYVRADKARRLLTGDQVEFRPAPPAADGSLEVRDVRSIKRKEQVLLCGVAEVAGISILLPDDPCFIPVQFAAQPPQGSFTTGDVVAVRVPAYEGRPADVVESGAGLQGVLVSNLGPRTREGFDLDYARMKHGFEKDMPLELVGLVASFEDPSSHVCDSTPFVTIDGESTRDFDDAVFAQRRRDGGWDVQVAVADVSYYVQPGSALDQWAAERGTSVYLPGLTLPMLPEWLSTDLCSLKPNVTRRAVVLRAQLAADGTVLTRSLGRTLISSAARLTYTEVAEFLATAPDAAEAENPVSQNLRTLYDVYQALARRRKEQGRLDFEDPEPTAKLRDGKLVVEWEVRNDAHKLVEELMLLANQEAAGMLVERYGVGVFRHQPAPSAEAWTSLGQWATERSLSLTGQPSLKAMADLVAAAEGELKAEAAMKVRMSMQPARYVQHTVEQLAQLGGHFSLSAPWYTHFTSPIRRYADLLVHRLLLAPEGASLTKEAVTRMGQLVEGCSEQSQGSRFAERLVWDRLKLNGFLAEHDKDAILSARVVRVTPRGLRVVVAGWQVPAWLPAAELKRAGITKGEGDTWVREGNSLPVREGAQLQVSWTDVNLERPAYPELLAKVAQ